jgi:hypothetical protein
MATIVTLLLKGSLVLFAKEGQPKGSVRFLKAPPPNHVLTLGYQKLPPNSDPEDEVQVTPIEDNLSITVNNPVNPNISLRDKNAKIDRKQAPSNQDSFRWFVDLENSELYDGPIGVKKSAFKHVLTFNSGNLFNDVNQDADNPSYNFLLIQKGGDANYQDFGFVSIRIGILFSANGSIVFTNGNGPNPVFDSSKDPAGTNYIINLTNDLDDNHTHPRLVTDANHYYKGIGSTIPLEERILFASITGSDGGGPAGPEACCFPAYLSRTDP